VRPHLRSSPRAALGFEHEETLAAGLDRLAKGDADVVLLDLNLPDSDGVDTVVRLRECDAAVPLVVLTGAGEEETGIAALAAGAQDYLVKDELGALPLRRSIRYAIERRRIAEQNHRLEQRLWEIEKLDSLGALCGGIAFGFNTQLGTIIDRCTSALAALDPRAREALRTPLLEIHRAAFQAAEMVQRLRDYSALERSASGEVDLARFVLEVSDFLQTIVAPEIDVTCEATGAPLRVEIGRSELQRVIVSLVVNAAEALPDRTGAISISTGMLEADEPLLADTHGWPDARPGRYAYLRVADSGCGLDADRRARIFDPFYTTKFAGRGLGLASVLGILHAQHGVVHVGANAPTGTVFTVLLPPVDPDAPKALRTRPR
jgi:signal transduction histidine kinase